MKSKRLDNIWENRKKILEGIKNSIIRDDAVEGIALERDKICRKCKEYDIKGASCTIPGTQPCCGACGCSLKLKQRSLSSGCDLGHWSSVLSDQEELDLEILKANSDDKV